MSLLTLSFYFDSFLIIKTEIVSNMRLTSDNNTTLSGTGTHHLRGRTSINTPLNNASTIENKN